MSKYYGKIGYAVTVEMPEGSGVYVDKVVERPYYGDLLRYTSSRWVPGEGVNDNVTINNQISILADPFAYEHFHNIKFAEFMGVAWKVTSIEVQRPRLLLSLGGEWNGERESDFENY